MKYYASHGFPLRRMPAGLKLILGLYLVTTCLGFGVAAMKYVLRDLLKPADIERYYLGGGDPGALLGVEPKSVSQLIDITHPHVFSVPLVLLVLCHLVQLCPLRQRVKNTLYLAAFGGMIATFAAPWLLRFVPACAILVSAGGAILTVAGTLLCVVPLFELARKPALPPADD